MTLIALLPYLPDLVGLGLKGIEALSKMKIEDISEEDFKKYLQIAQGNVKHWADL